MPGRFNGWGFKTLQLQIMTNKELKEETGFYKSLAQSINQYNAAKDAATKTVYIAGKVTGLPYREVFKKFDDAQFALEAQGWHVLNPCLLCSEDTEYNTAMCRCIAALTTADAIYLLPDWVDSKGARFEAFVAGQLGIEIIHGF